MTYLRHLNKHGKADLSLMICKCSEPETILHICVRILLRDGLIINPNTFIAKHFKYVFNSVPIQCQYSIPLTIQYQLVSKKLIECDKKNSNELSFL